tara:strand:+ start:22833 stop:23483 length:651 start_codon:yes stop_codon:yes gene_type:complete
MANQTITFDPESGVAYGANLTINGGANFKSTFEVKRPSGVAFDLTGYSGSSQMMKSAAVGSTAYPLASFTVGFTSAVDGTFYLSLGSTATRTLDGGRYVYNVLLNSESISNTSGVLETGISVGNTAGIGTTVFNLLSTSNVAVGDSVSIGSTGELVNVPVVTIPSSTSVEVGAAFTVGSSILPGTAVTFSRVSTSSTIYAIADGYIEVKPGISSAP